MVDRGAAVIVDNHSKSPQKLGPYLQLCSDDEDTESEASNPTSRLPTACIKLLISRIGGISMVYLANLYNRSTPVFEVYLYSRFLFGLLDPGIKRYI